LMRALLYCCRLAVRYKVNQRSKSQFSGPFCKVKQSETLHTASAVKVHLGGQSFFLEQIRGV
jgi:hypothetical protein